MLFYPVFSILITGVVMMLINPPLTQIYTGISAFLEGLGGTNLVLVGLLLGGMMAVDMGGPVNKAAFTRSASPCLMHRTSISWQRSWQRAWSHRLDWPLQRRCSKKKFTKTEREAGKTAYVLGASFITEGVIPFAAADPARVIPSAVAGAATTGALVMLFDIGLRAPHGGVFVIGLVDGERQAS
ncbi:fructose-specific PTS transporter subunit EIIC [Planococcus sp. MB-3u-03]|uniref:fructose-specific PTS transporter subunit EIIC n=1 Tax=Planococcus sp. MB-3u-03 TaxID=2058136 RepID=UPI001E4AF2C9|nr:fructose-specific PTS transporter subunit EIIC [Planococcus sp. MB-3u-03]